MADEPITPPPKGVTAAEMESTFRRLLDEKAKGDPDKLARALHKLVVDLRSQLETAQAKVLPVDHVAIPKADADLLASYKALGPVKDLETSSTALASYKALGTPEELKDAKDELPAIKGTLAQRDHETGLATVAGKLGWSPDVLKRLAPIGTSFVPAKDKDPKGKEIDTFKVKDVGPDGKERTRTLAEWEATEDVKVLLPALKPVTSESPRRDLPVSGSSGYQGRDSARRDGEFRPATSPQIDPTRRLAMEAAGSI